MTHQSVLYTAITVLLLQVACVGTDVGNPNATSSAEPDSGSSNFSGDLGLLDQHGSLDISAVEDLPFDAGIRDAPASSDATDVLTHDISFDAADTTAGDALDAGQDGAADTDTSDDLGDGTDGSETGDDADESEIDDGGETDE